MMQNMIKVLGLTETTEPLTGNTFDIWKKGFWNCGGRGVGGVGALVTCIADEHSFFDHQRPDGALTTEMMSINAALDIRLNSIIKLRKEEIQSFYMELDQFSRDDHFCFLVAGEFNVKIGQAERMKNFT